MTSQLYNGPSQIYCIKPEGRIHLYINGKKVILIYQSPLILTKLFQHLIPNKRFLSRGMLPFSGHDDVALFE